MDVVYRPEKITPKPAEFKSQTLTRNNVTSDTDLKHFYRAAWNTDAV